VDLRIAAAKIEKAVEDHRTPGALHEFGLSLLVADSTSKAVPALEEAADQNPPSPAVLADLAAAYLVRATEQQRLEDTAKGLAVTERAIKADPNISEAWFNRALALERLSLTVQAREAWQEYLKRDRKSFWSQEAQVHIDSLTEKLQAHSATRERQQVQQAAQSQDPVLLRRVYHEYPEAARLWLEEQLLDVWPKGELSGDSTTASRVLALITPLAKVMREQTDDAFWLDTINAVEASLTSEKRRLELAHAHARYRQALSEFEGVHMTAADQQFRQTLPTLDRAQSPFADFARFCLAVVAFYNNNYPDANKQFDSLLAQLSHRHYLRLLGLIHRGRGVIHGRQSEWGAALEDYDVALNYFLTSGDPVNVAGIHGTIAEGLDYLGETRLAWLHRATALSGIDGLGDRWRRNTIFSGAANATARQDLPETALHFQNVVLDEALQWGTPLAIAQGYLYRATLLHGLGRAELAANDLREAERSLARLADPGIATMELALTKLKRGEIEQSTNPTDAAESLIKALELFSEVSTAWPETRVYLALGRAHLNQGRADLAESDLSKGIEAFERQRQALLSDAQRASYFEQPSDIFGEMIRLQATKRHDPSKALQYAERARARTLLEQIAGDTETPSLDPSGIMRELPPNVRLVYYSVLEDRLLIWVVGHRGTQSAQVPLRAEELMRSVRAFRAALEQGPNRAEVLEKSSWLYDRLVRPVAGFLPQDSDVVIVPDGPLHAVPFAGLLNRETSRYLIQDHGIALAPSGTIFERALRGSTDVASQPLRSALVIGNPSPMERGLEYPNLPDAEAEARDVAALYPTRKLLVGIDASKERFLQDAGRYDVVHFAGHAVANTDHPNFSRLIFAGRDHSQPGSLLASELVGASYPKTRLVVLAACDTGAGAVRRGEGVLTFARAFLAAGVPTVVASLWNLDDRASRILFEKFHASIRQGASSSRALRMAQLALLSSSDATLQAPSHWAGVITVGK
jgi:CHAT domain-containing protein